MLDDGEQMREKIDMSARSASDKFSLGQIKIQRDSLPYIHQSEIKSALDRHARGEWGDVDTTTRNANSQGLTKPGWIISKFNCSLGKAYKIVTAPDRSVTLISVVA